jgi:MOSC domain-containing protein YiiM
MRIISVNVGMPAMKAYGDKQVTTGGYKQPVASAMLRLRGFEGDGQADLVNHGSPDQAALIFAAEYYPGWEERLGRKLSPGAFSENLTVEGATESAICVGDVFRVGDALVQATQPRQPCSKLARKLGEPRLVDWVIDAHQGGIYVRVLEEGWVSSDATFELITRHPDRISIATVNDVIYDRVRDRALLARLAEMPEFSADGRRRLAQKLSRLE